MAPVDIRPYSQADEAAIVKLWTRCGLVMPWNDPLAVEDVISLGKRLETEG